MSARIAVVGGGIFGVTAAILLGREGKRVSLFEAGPELLSAASGINQYRLHRGYHYPRDPATAVSARDSVESFRAMFPRAVIDGDEHFYAIASRDSLVDAGRFTRFLDEMGLEYRPAEPSWLRRDAVEMSFLVRESRIDLRILRETAREHLRDSGVTVNLNRHVRLAELEDHDFVVIATYASLNELLGELGEGEQSLQFEVVEKPVVRVPASLRRLSLVVLDGPFMCIDPCGPGDLSVMGNVVHAIHHSSVGLLPEIPPTLAPFLDRGIVSAGSRTKMPLFVESAAEFVPEITLASHVGSMFTVRTVLPDMDATDARPTLVRRHGPRVITVLSGKIGTCVVAGREVASIVARRIPDQAKVA